MNHPLSQRRDAERWTTRTVRNASALVTIFLCSASLAQSEERLVTGRLIDAEGRSLQDAEVSAYWRANGPAVKPDGSPFDLSLAEDHDAFWGNLGNMQPWRAPAKTDREGEFKISLSRAVHLMAMDSAREQGGIVELGKSNPLDSISIRLNRLVTVRGQLKSSLDDKPATWSHVSVELPMDPTHPLASRSVVLCGTVDGKFQFQLPRGSYLLRCYGRSVAGDEETFLAAKPHPKLDIDGTNDLVSLGTIALELAPPDRGVREKSAKREGRWRDHTKHYGEPAPQWHAVDARGITSQTKIQDFRGKWLLISFWGLGCLPCLETSIPKLTDFHEAHADQKDHFEIVGVCIDHRGEMQSLAELDQALAPIINHVWKGKQIPYPIVLDNSFETWERFGIPGLGTVVLVDPSGNLHEGDETTLDRILGALSDSP